MMPMRPMLLLPLALLLAALHRHGAAACSSASDCSLAGECRTTSSTGAPAPHCVCDAGFEGPSCAALALRPAGASRSIDNIPGAHIGNTTISTVWGGHSAQDADGRWHWFGSAILDGKGLEAWTDDSATGRGEGNSSAGPFSLSEIALRPGGGTAWDGGSIHGVYLVRNPKPWANRTDSWLLFYTGECLNRIWLVAVAVR
jgi:hypothetical protein